jgi:creatinine amidohydrolase
MKWEELKWTTVSAISKDVPVIIPLGSIEQHGLHLPLCTDTAQVASIADAIEARLTTSVLVLPVLWLGSSHHHLDFAGTLSVRPSLYSQVLQELSGSILRAGFKRLFFLNGHGGNETPAKQALSELATIDPMAQEALIALSSWWTIGKPDAQQHGMETPMISHACEYETSLMLWLRPDLVELGKARDSSPTVEDTWLTNEKRVSLFRRFAVFTGYGNLGTPSAATADKGKSIHSAVVDDIVLFLNAFAKWPLPSKIGPMEVLA